MIWVGLITRNFYQARIGHLMRDINWLVVVGFYFVFLLGLTYFAIYPAVISSSFLVAITLGLLFGFFTYVTYDLTNLTILQNWLWSVTIVDIIWGSLLSMFVTVANYYIYSLF